MKSLKIAKILKSTCLAAYVQSTTTPHSCSTRPYCEGNTETQQGLVLLYNTVVYGRKKLLSYETYSTLIEQSGQVEQSGNSSTCSSIVVDTFVTRDNTKCPEGPHLMGIVLPMFLCSWNLGVLVEGCTYLPYGRHHFYTIPTYKVLMYSVISMVIGKFKGSNIIFISKDYK